MDTVNYEFCVDCQLQQLDPVKPATNFRYGPQCSRHYRQSHNTRPKCKTKDCTARLNPIDRKTRNCHCRKCEGICLQQKRPETILAALDRVGKNVWPQWDTSCWLWHGKMTKGTSVEKTYGLINVGSKAGECGVSGRHNRDEWRVHRFMLVHFLGAHSHGREVDHVCGTSLCVNPTHLTVWPPWVHREWTNARKEAPERPWYLHSNEMPVTLPFIAFAFTYNLPLRAADFEWNEGVQKLSGA